MQLQALNISKDLDAVDTMVLDIMVDSMDFTKFIGASDENQLAVYKSKLSQDMYDRLL